MLIEGKFVSPRGGIPLAEKKSTQQYLTPSLEYTKDSIYFGNFCKFLKTIMLKKDIEILYIISLYMYTYIHVLLQDIIKLILLNQDMMRQHIFKSRLTNSLYFNIDKILIFPSYRKGISGYECQI